MLPMLMSLNRIRNDADLDDVFEWLEFIFQSEMGKSYLEIEMILGHDISFFFVFLVSQLNFSHASRINTFLI